MAGWRWWGSNEAGCYWRAGPRGVRDHGGAFHYRNRGSSLEPDAVVWHQCRVTSLLHARRGVGGRRNYYRPSGHSTPIASTEPKNSQRRRIRVPHKRTASFTDGLRLDLAGTVIVQNNQQQELS
jgi:hypothetical protein